MLSRTESERTLRFEVEAFDESKGRVLIERAIVEGHVGGVKTERSEAELPLAQIIKESLLRCEEGRIWFSTAKGTSPGVRSESLC